jgi:proteasome lid subunit RPN8/RPN11
MPRFNLNDIVFSVERQAENHWPDECCGFINDRGELVPVANEARDKRKNFFISVASEKYVSRRHVISGVYHSHVDASAYVSKADRAGAGSMYGLYIVTSVVAGVARETKVFLHNQEGFSQVKLPCPLTDTSNCSKQ